VGEVQVTNAPSSSEHAKLTASSLVKVNVALADVCGPDGPPVICVLGGVVSIRNGPKCDPWLQLPVSLRVRRWNHEAPSGRTDSARGAAPSTTVSGSVAWSADHS
jgi:hypothetical protein